MRILILGERSGVIRDTFISKGYNAISCDNFESDKLGPSENRASIRSTTYHGWADAMVAQWGILLKGKNS